ncbi:enoyl-CoA-hydratase DpgB [Streptomyces phyllanthi]|uniref:enoyl-CoA-hydratase DpgB n=1 Tax=Streptomyces phyllanthi TaxID=1803180 RepID=UPI002AD26D4D|nr:enoyl-CoA-hydratase DpgB [Streptomyces phyllanthi]
MTRERDDLVIRVDGRRPLSAELVAAFEVLCDRVEDRADRNTVIMHVSGAPGEPSNEALTIALVSKWERALRRFERLPAATVAVASDECGGVALEALLATDYRIGTASLRLLMARRALVTWPGMALYRIVRQAGSAAARRAVLLGIPITAADAVATGLIDELTVDTQAALTAAMELAEAIPGPELAIRRQLMHDAPAVSFEEALGAHLAACERALRLSSAEAGR